MILIFFESVNKQKNSYRNISNSTELEFEILGQEFN